MNVMHATNELVFLPLGGVGEIGMNLYLYGYGTAAKRKWLIVDFGINFSSGDRLPGIDLIFPDIQFLCKERDNIVGIVITHAHEDHFGALLELWPKVRAPVYMTEFARRLLDAKAAEETDAPRIDVKLFKSGDCLALSPFKVEAVDVTHSIPEAMSLIIRTEIGTLIHTGDWRIDHRPVLGKPSNFLQRFREVSSDGVLALVCDSTNITEPGVSPSTMEVFQCLSRLIREAPGRVAITTFASNVERLRVVAEAARDNGRKLVILGRAMRRIAKIALELGLFDGLPPLFYEDAYHSIPRNKVVVLMTGSQGEPRAALSTVSMGGHKTVSLDEGDTVIFSSRIIPGNELMVNGIINRLAMQNVNVITDKDIPLVHVSGHPKQDEVAELYLAVKPKLLIPVHGEPLHIKVHDEFARKNGIDSVLRCKNGMVVKLAPGEPEVLDSMYLRQVFKDGRILITSEDPCVEERYKISVSGVVMLGIVINSDGELCSEPDIELIGVPLEDIDGNSFDDICLDIVDSSMNRLSRSRRSDYDAVRASIKKDVGTAIARRWGKKPLIEVMVFVV